MPSREELIEAQMREYPNSVILTPIEVFRWCDEFPDITLKYLRYVEISMAIQYERVIFYRIEGTKYRGFRFGVQGHEYMSLH